MRPKYEITINLDSKTFDALKGDMSLFGYKGGNRQLPMRFLRIAELSEEIKIGWEEAFGKMVDGVPQDSVIVTLLFQKLSGEIGAEVEECSTPSTTIIFNGEHTLVSMNFDIDTGWSTIPPHLPWVIVH